MNSFYTEEELNKIGFKKVGINNLISRKASIYNPEKIELNDNIRIDDFCFLSGNIVFKGYNHISANCILVGGDKGILFEKFSGLSSKVTIYSVTDDYSGDYLTNPTVPKEYTKIYSKKVELGKHVIVGTGSTILLGVKLGIGSAIGSMSLVTKDTKEWGIYAGIPAQYKKDRSKKILELEKKLLNEN